jgi:hypothetical protein
LFLRISYRRDIGLFLRISYRRDIGLWGGDGPAMRMED